ncbi:hypothetical protein PGT21_036427 [Puccinia graminis f. sp. tritici]|uniref:LON peptidase N-terminal domain and RING finger protein 3 n=2 Tax=Puccinia graminis f. sp. tritici TaxID=56615 RepID=A0A5B0Q056_PUCGR|nr:hypothetical protein PGT21_036427 [Puccinia graminis f. sp. tritici]KAA1126211.1 hypothetical protein PGTUg99_014267 [Puccinia graminis f. sp. tritici]
MEECSSRPADDSNCSSPLKKDQDECSARSHPMEIDQQHQQDQQEPADHKNHGSCCPPKDNITLEEAQAQQAADNQILREKLTNLLTCVKLIDPSSAPASPPLPPACSPSAQGLESHLLYKPITLDSGYSLCSACYDFYPHELPPASQKHLQPSHQLSPVLTLDDHRHLAQPSPTVNFILQKVVQIVRNLPPKPAGDSSIGATLRAELECPLCSFVFDSPVTISCGHTFCRSCFLRARDHADHCPVCRQPFLMGPQAVPGVDLLIDRIIEQCLAPSTGTAGPASAVNLETNHTIPLMVCSIGFPEMPMFLQIFEPRYKLLIRRSLSTDRKFGIVIPAFDHQPSSEFDHHYSTIIRPTADQNCQPNLPVHLFGTIVEIRKYETAADGRMLIEARGCDRFRIEGLLGSLDGYLVAKIRVFGDMPVQDARLEAQAKEQALYQHHHHSSEPKHHRPEPTTEKLMNTCKEFIEVLRSGSSPWILERLNDTFGPMPDQPTEFTYWIAMVLPISDQYKAALLPIISYRSRLKILVRWIRVLKSQWNSQGCLIT